MSIEEFDLMKAVLIGICLFVIPHLASKLILGDMEDDDDL